MREVKSKQINDCSYEVTQLGAIKGRSLLTRLARILGAGGGDMAKSLGMITEEDMSYICDSFSEVTVVKQPDGKAPYLKNIFDMHFAGKYDEMIQWLMFCLEINFGSFLDVKSIGDKAQAVQGSSESSSPKVVTG
jgi:hypothetical protein